MPTGEGQGLGCPWQCPPDAGWCGTAPDDAWVFPPVPCGPAPLLHHHHGLPAGEEATEEKGEWGCEQQPQAVEGIVACQAGAAEVKGGVQLDGDRSQQQADAVHHRLGAGLEVLEEHAELIHGSRLVRAVSFCRLPTTARPPWGHRRVFSFKGLGDKEEAVSCPLCSLRGLALHEGFPVQPDCPPVPLPSSPGE